MSRKVHRYATVAAYLLVAVALTGACERLWSRRLPFVPTTLCCITPAGGDSPWIVIGGEGGSVTVLDAAGQPVREARLPATPTKILALFGEHAVVFGTNDGHIATCAMVLGHD